jgi:hypothetical protein
VDKDKEDIVKKDDHYIDAIRYGAWKLKNRWSMLSLIDLFI